MCSPPFEPGRNKRPQMIRLRAPWIRVIFCTGQIDRATMRFFEFDRSTSTLLSPPKVNVVVTLILGFITQGWHRNDSLGSMFDVMNPPEIFIRSHLFPVLVRDVEHVQLLCVHDHPSPIVSPLHASLLDSISFRFHPRSIHIYDIPMQTNAQLEQGRPSQAEANGTVIVSWPQLGRIPSQVGGWINRPFSGVRTRAIPCRLSS